MNHEPIPTGVIWVPENGAFYRGTDQSAGLYNGDTFMGQAFKAKWIHRAHEFPQDASPRVIQ